jgi:chemosensory pili system protein ChpA (sensor histidine kinase/response regulator)
MVREIFDDAKHSMFQSARGALEDVKRAVTSFVESGYSPNSLANTGREFSAVKGSLAILEHERAADIANRTGEAVARFVDRGGAQSREELAEALADVLICLEYYVASLENDEEPDAMMLKIAEDSLRLFEQQVAEAS